MKLDSAFQIGKTHDICEDFALVRNKKDNLPYIIVSDGCSSSQYTDVGSRILALTASDQIEGIVNETDNLRTFNPEVCLVQSQHICDSLNIPRCSVDATLLTAIVTGVAIQAEVYGDGVIAMGTKDGEITVLNFEYKQGYPFYLSYLPEQSKGFRHWNNEYNSCDITPYIIRDTENSITMEEKTSFSGIYKIFENDTKKPTIVINGENWRKHITIYNSYDDVKWIALMSDGIHSFYKTEDSGTSLVNTDINYINVIAELFNFKNFNGKFMQRRLNRFLKFCQKNNWYHADDISFGAIYLGD